MKTLKKIFIALVIALSFTSTSLMAQDTTGFSMPTSYVIQVDSTLNAKELTTRYVNWVSKNFKSANDVIQLKDLENSNVVIKCVLNTKYTSMGVPGEGVTYCTIEFKAKDGKYKVSFTDIYFHYYQGVDVTYEICKGALNKKSSVRYVIDVNKEIKTIVESIEQSLQTTVNKNDDF